MMISQIVFPSEPSSSQGSTADEWLSCSSKDSRNGQDSTTWQDVHFQLASLRNFSPSFRREEEMGKDKDVENDQASMDMNLNHLPNCEKLPKGDTWQVAVYGDPGSLRYRMLFLDNLNRKISPWHNLPLHTSGHRFLTFVCKTPTGKWMEYELAKEEPFSPLRVKKIHGRPGHYVKNVPWNYGFFPQTWTNSCCDIRGSRALRQDGRPMEVIDISEKVGVTGDVYTVKLLAAVLVIEEGLQPSWKVVTIASDDKLSLLLNGLEDLFHYLPGKVEEIQTWLQTKDCTSPRKKQFGTGLNGQTADEKLATQIVARAHASWQLCVNQQRIVENSNASQSCDYEKIWEQNTVNESGECMPLCEQEQTSALRYEHAWIQSTTTEDLECSKVVESSPANPPGDTYGQRPILRLGSEGSRKRMWLSFLKRQKHKGKVGVVRAGGDVDKGHLVVDPFIARKKQYVPVFHTQSPSKLLAEGRRHSLDEATMRKLAASPANDAIGGRRQLGKSVEFRGDCDMVTGGQQEDLSDTMEKQNIPSQLMAEWEELCALGKKHQSPDSKQDEEENGRSTDSSRDEDESRTMASLLRLTSHLAKVRNQQISAEELLEGPVEQTVTEGSGGLKRKDSEVTADVPLRFSQSPVNRSDQQRGGA